MDKQLICTQENIREFNANIRREIQEAHDIARALVESGLMDGLRGARIGPVGSFEAGVVPTLSDAAEKRLADAAWARQQGRSCR